MFLTESIAIGIAGGLFGIGLGLLLSPMFATAIGGQIGEALVLSLEVIVLASVRLIKPPEAPFKLVTLQLLPYLLQDLLIIEERRLVTYFRH